MSVRVTGADGRVIDENLNAADAHASAVRVHDATGEQVTLENLSNGDVTHVPPYFEADEPAPSSPGSAPKASKPSKKDAAVEEPAGGE